MGERILGEQKNELSENLQRIRKRDRVFYPLLFFFIGLAVATLNIYFRHSTNAWVMALYYAVVFFLPVALYFAYPYLDGTWPKTVYYSSAGIRWITYKGKEVFVPWEQVVKVFPVGDYGKIMGYGNGKVSDYALMFRKPFIGRMSIITEVGVSEEVGRKIEEYLREFREKEGFLNKANK